MGKIDRLTLVGLFLSLSAYQATLACFSAPESNEVINNVDFRPTSKKFVRCINDENIITCRDTACKGGELMRPQLQSFDSLAKCLAATYTVACFNPSQRICIPDTPGCNRTFQVQWPNDFTYYSNVAECQAALPEAANVWIRCNDHGMPVCRYEKCHQGENFLSTGEGFYSDEDMCNRHLFWARSCYVPRSQPGSPANPNFYYDLITTFDTQNGRCSDAADRLIVEQYSPAADRDTASDAANAIYSERLPMTHVRCNVNGEPVCRPLGVMSDHDDHMMMRECGKDEMLLKGTPRESWPNLISCNAERFWGLVCYHPTRVNPFYEIYVNVTQFPTCGPGDLALGQVSADTYEHLLERANNMYSRGKALPHQRCGLRQNGDIYLPICRPLLPSDNNCSVNEDRLGLTPINRWNTYGDCLEERFWGIGCYTANKDKEPFYTYHTVWDSPIAIRCPINSALLGLLNASFSAEMLDERLAVYYTPKTQLTHRRCDVDGVPVCRPDVDQTSVDFCGQDEHQIGRTDNTTFGSLAVCLSQRYWRLACYRPLYGLSPGVDRAFYEIYAVDALNGGCDQGDLALRYYSAATVDELPTVDAMKADYINATRQTIRCEVWDESQNKMIPVCRPNFGTANACPHFERRLTSTPINTWNNLVSCNLMRYWGIGCYFPNQDKPDDFYDHKVVWDNHLSLSCPVNSRRTTPAANYSSDPDLLETYIAPAYGLKTQLTHRRCSVEVALGDVRPVCRPDIDGGSVDGCAVGERRITSTQTNTWGTLELCRQQLYWTLICYHPTATDPYYELIRKIVDRPGVACDNGDLKIGEFSDNNSEDFLTNDVAVEYYENLFFTHVRCFNKEADETICRPQFGYASASTGNNCPPDEYALAGTQVTVWNSVKQCNNQRFWAVACYKANTDAEPFYNIEAVEGTNDGFICPPNSVRIGPMLYDANRTDLHNRIQELYNEKMKLTHRRCDVGGIPVCRPAMNAADFCGEDETQIMGTTPLTWPTLGGCLAQRYWAAGCYTTNDTEPYYEIYAATNANALECAPGDVQLVIQGAETQQEAIDSVLNWYTLRTRLVSHTRCALPGSSIPVCRPRYPTLNQCPENEERVLTLGTGGWNSLDACEEYKHWAYACYVAKTENPYYEIKVYNDTTSSSGAICPEMSSVRLIVNLNQGTYVYGSNFAQLEITLKSYYNESVQMDHFRCQTADGNVVCRPTLDGGVGDGCALNEVRMGTVPGDTLGRCNAAKYWARICYIPKQILNDFYDITFCFDHQCSSCNGSQIQINSVPMSNMSLSQAQAESYYTPTTRITHVRCSDVNGVPYCRPNSTCADGETRIGTTTWATLELCEAQRWVALACYTVRDTAPFYEIYNVTFAGGSCATGDHLLGTFTAGDKSSAEHLAAGYYTRTLLLRHQRCNFGGIPVCRPSYSTISTCPNDEENISSGQGAFVSLDDCENQLHRAFGCYIATDTPPDYFNLTIYRDSSYAASAVCPAYAARISAMLQDSDFSRLTNRIYQNYNLTAQFDHIRCDVGNDAVCRPVLSDPGNAGGNGDGCGHGETRITATTNSTWTTFGFCNKQRYWSRSCYVPLYETEDPYYEFNMVPDYEQTFCPTNEFQIMLHSGPTDSRTVFDAQAQAFYPSAAIVHWRCGGTDGYPYCRPGAQCFVNETRLNATGVTAAYGSFNLCQNQRWWARVCYSPHYNGSFGDDYELYEFYDSYPNPVCAGSDLSLMWASSAAADVAAASYYSDTTAMVHWRCKSDADPYPYCRPLQCFPGETRLSGTTTWPNLGACQTQRFTARVCYTPLSIESKPYVLSIRYDHVDSGCLTNETQLAILTGDTGDFLTPEEARAIYDQEILLTHVRCEANDAAFCRPSPCPATETRIGSTTYTSKAACEAVRFAAIACVNDLMLNSENNFNYTCVMDTQGCQYRSAGIYTGSNRSEAEANCYSSSAFPPAYDRCQGASDSFCRQASNAACPAGYNKVLWNVALSRCLVNSTMYAMCIDYDIQLNPIADDIEAWNCYNNTDFGCQDVDEVRVATNFSSEETCLNYRSFSSWHKCVVSNVVTCRPNAFNVGCGTVTPSGSYSSVSECLDGTYCKCTGGLCREYSHEERRCLCPPGTTEEDVGMFWTTPTCP